MNRSRLVLPVTLLAVCVLTTNLRAADRLCQPCVFWLPVPDYEAQGQVSDGSGEPKNGPHSIQQDTKDDMVRAETYKALFANKWTRIASGVYFLEDETRHDRSDKLMKLLRSARLPVRPVSSGEAPSRDEIIDRSRLRVVLFRSLSLRCVVM